MMKITSNCRTSERLRGGSLRRFRWLVNSGFGGRNLQIQRAVVPDNDLTNSCYRLSSIFLSSIILSASPSVMPRLILASQSRHRLELLRSAGYEVEAVPAETLEPDPADFPDV